jgi:acetyl-CoA C-acetyltransferase
MKEVVIIDGVRTPIGKLGGIFKSTPSYKLGEIVVREIISRTKIDVNLIDEVVFGCVVQTSDAPNISRVIALRAGIPYTKPAYTVHRNCASGIQAIVEAYHNIQCNDADVQIVGGTESMSLAPYVNRDMRFGKHLQHSMMIDSLWEGLTDPICGQIMGLTAENLAEEFNITREEQDKFAIESHKKAFRATREGKFKEEIVPVTVKKEIGAGKYTEEKVSEDESINIGLTEQILALYPTIFKENGTVTPGNSCPISDGAVALLMMSKEKAKELGYTPLAYIKSYAFVGVEPHRMGIGPAEAIPVALRKAGITLKDIELIEVNEAFAAQYLSVEKKLGLNREIVNVNGGAIALGHPVGATGARIVLTLIKEMKRRNLTLGLAALCVGGGLGAAIILERK